MRTPERQCIGCGRRGPQDSFARFESRQVDGARRVVIAEGRRHNGRSAYLCRRPSCLERALVRKAFQRAFRTSVEIDKDSLENEIRTIDSDGPCGSGCR